MVEDPNWELALLATVQAFYQRLLSEQLGGEIPAPAELAPEAIGHAEDPRPTLQKMHLWIQLLDMAISPAMLRVGMSPDLDAEVAEALLRYFARHRDDSAANRDKTDLVATFLYRHPRVPGQWERHGYGLDGSIPLSPFEIALLEILSESDVPALPEEHVQLLREFGPLLEQANRFQDFNSLMDSGIISRVRELKNLLGESMYHPGVLATLAPYNSSFGRRFDVLFSTAAREIRDFARQLEELGGSILSTVEGVEVTVDHVSALDEKALLQIDYAAALDKFRRFAQLKKEIERRPPIRRAQFASSAATSARHSGGAAAAAAPARSRQYVPASVTPQSVATEEAKVRRVEESIRVFVRVADPKFRQIVPMRYFNLMLSPAEIDACTADFLEQNSPRADVARAVLRLVAMSARMMTEMEELKRAPRLSTLWRLHADSLMILIELARRVPDGVASLTATPNRWTAATETGGSIGITLDKLRARAAEAEKVLRTL
ncbi:MAG: hypothetical protein WB817_19120 [Terriglobales bacterium]